MERVEVAEVVKKHILEILEDLKASDLDTSQSLVDLGATSLDIVEIVSASMRELKVKVPRSELKSIENIDGLVDKLLVATQP